MQLRFHGAEQRIFSVYRIFNTAVITVGELSVEVLKMNVCQKGDLNLSLFGLCKNGIRAKEQKRVKAGAVAWHFVLVQKSGNGGGGRLLECEGIVRFMISD